MDVRVAKTVSIPRIDDSEKVAFAFTNEAGEVSITRVSTANKVRCTMADLEEAVRLLK